MTVNMADIHRLTHEIEAQFGDEFFLDKWAEVNNVEPDALRGLVNAAVNAVRQSAIDSAAEILSGAEPELDEDGHYIKMNIGELIANSCYHCFIIGWEASRQYGSRR